MSYGITGGDHYQGLASEHASTTRIRVTFSNSITITKTNESLEVEFFLDCHFHLLFVGYFDLPIYPPFTAIVNSGAISLYQRPTRV